MKKAALLLMSFSVLATNFILADEVEILVDCHEQHSYFNHYKNKYASFFRRVTVYCGNKDTIKQGIEVAVVLVTVGTMGGFSLYYLKIKKKNEYSPMEKISLLPDKEESPIPPIVQEEKEIDIQPLPMVVNVAEEKTLNQRLIEALLNSDFKTIAEALDNGADPNIYINKGLYPHAMIVIVGNIIRDRNVEQWLQVVQLFKDKGVNLDAAKTSSPNYQHEDIPTVRQNLHSLVYGKENSYEEVHPGYQERLQKIAEILTL